MEEIYNNIIQFQKDINSVPINTYDSDDIKKTM